MKELGKSKHLEFSSLQEVFNLADVLLKTKGFVPDCFLEEKVNRVMVKKEYEVSRNEVAAVFLKGQELGMGPMSSLQNIYIYKGNLGVRYHAVVGLLQREGYGIEWHEHTDHVADVELTNPAGKTFRYRHTLEKANKLGLTRSRKDSYNNEYNPWITMPDIMLRARAITTACRSFCGGVLSGMYEMNEIEEMKQNDARRNEKVVSVVEIDENATGAERLLKAMETKTEPVEPVEEVEDVAKVELVEEYDKSVRSCAFIELNAMLNEAKTQPDLAMCVVKIGASKTISDDEKDELRTVYQEKKDELT